MELPACLWRSLLAVDTFLSVFSSDQERFRPGALLPSRTRSCSRLLEYLPSHQSVTWADGRMGGLVPPGRPSTGWHGQGRDDAAVSVASGPACIRTCTYINRHTFKRLASMDWSAGLLD